MGEPSTPASDRYALAVVAFELLTGASRSRRGGFAAQARAHVDDDPPAASDDPISLQRWTSRARPRHGQGAGRPLESAAAFVRALDDALSAFPRPPTQRPLPAPPLRPRRARARSGSRWPWLLVVAAPGDRRGRRRASSPAARNRSRTQPAARNRGRTRAKPSRTPGRTPRKTREPVAAATATRTARQHGTDLDRAAAQLQGYNARVATTSRRSRSRPQAALTRAATHGSSSHVWLRPLRGRRLARRARPPGRGDRVPPEAAGPVRVPNKRSREGAQGCREGGQEG